MDATLSTAPRRALDHPGQERAAEVRDRLDVRADHRDLLGRVALVDRSHGREARVVHEHLDGEAALLHLRDEVLARRHVGQVGGGHLRADVVGRRQLVGQLPQRRLPPCDERDAVAALGQLARQVDADARRGSGDQAGAVGSGGGEAHARIVGPGPRTLAALTSG